MKAQQQLENTGCCTDVSDVITNLGNEFEILKM
jgi:hypothetical protein